MHRFGSKGILAAVGAVAATLALLGPAPAAVGASLCTAGTGAGQCKEPRGLASDWESGRLYLADRGNNRIDAFDSASNSSLFSFGAGEMGSPGSVAVDNDPLSGSHEDVYVADLGGKRVLKYLAPLEAASTATVCREGEFAGAAEMRLASGPGGALYVADSSGSTIRLREYGSGCGAPLREKAAMATGSLGGLAVDSSGDIYIRGKNPDQSFCKYDASSWEALFCFTGDDQGGVRALALDEADHLFAGGLDRDQEIHFYRTIAEYTPTGEALRRSGYGELNDFIEGLAVRPGGNGPAYASVGEEVRIVPFQVGPAALPRKAEGVSSAQATLGAEVNPEGLASEVHFEYLTREEFEDQSESFTGPDTKSTPTEALGAEDVRLHHAEGLVGCPDPVSEAGLPESPCLLPKTEYLWRVVAANSESPPGEPTVAIGTPFETGSLEVLDTWPDQVGVDGATLHLSANPAGVPSSAFFEYITEAAYQANLKAGGKGFEGAAKVPDEGHPLELGAGLEPVSRSISLFPLAAHTAYRFRTVATNPLLSEAAIGKERSFTTLAQAAPTPCATEGTRGGLAGARLGAGAFLPDCRAYELVSPLDKNNADIVYGTAASGRLPITLEQSSTDGGRMAYTSMTAFADPDGAPFVSQYLASRGAGEGWVSHDISSKRDRLLAKGAAQFDTEFEAFSPDLCKAWPRTVSDPPLVAGAVEGQLNLYRRRDEECGGKAYAPITTTPPPHLAPENYALELQGTSADGERAIYRANDSLAGTGAPGEPGECTSKPTKCEQRLYSQSAGEGSRYACVLPDKTAAPNCAAGTSGAQAGPQRFRDSNVQNAISADGTRIFWSTPAPGEGKLYMRDNHGTDKGADDTTTAVSAGGETATGASKSRYWCAAADGSVAIYSSGGRLFEFHPDLDLTHEIAAEAVGVAGCSEDASQIYLGSRKALSGANVREANSEGASAIAGKVNLYLYEAAGTPGDPGAYAFVATLAQYDIANPGPLGPLAGEPSLRLSRISPDGGALAFMSAAGPASEASEGVPAPTDFDNTDAANGEADMEAYLYDAGTGKLACASCNPSGARPVGININPSGESKSNSVWAAGWIPVWENPLYAARALSDSGGRLFFESTDRLVARDTNGRTDVYQWEAPGEGECTPTAPPYSPRNAGCVQLISSGQAPGDADFRDASPSGEDVFFATPTSLLPQDYGLIDIYDARVGGGLPTPEPATPPCEGEACQSPAPAPQAPTPASSAYEGPGNLNKPAARKRRCPKGKRKVRRRGKVHCQKRRRAKHRRHARHHHRHGGRSR